MTRRSWPVWALGGAIAAGLFAAVLEFQETLTLWMILGAMVGLLCRWANEAPL